MSDQGIIEPPVDGAMPDGQPPVSPGARLAAYRRERGWTVEQVANQLNLAPRQVVAIENDDYPALPGMPIVRGFIRAYAKLLKVDAVPLLSTLGGETVFAQQVAPGRNLQTPFSEKRLPSMTDRPALSSKWIVGLLLALLIGVAIWASGLVQLPDMSTAPSRSADSVEGPRSAAGTVPAESANGEKLPAQDMPTVGAPNLGGPDAGAAAVPPAPAAETGQVAQPAPAAVPGPNAQPASENALTLKTREESWIEIRRASDKKLMFSRLVKAGETETFEVNEPVSIIIGNAAGVEATLRGEPIALKPGTKSNVARLSVK